MWGLLALIAVVVLMGGCAIAFSGSTAKVNTEITNHREVAKDSATIEDVLTDPLRRR